MSQIPNSSSALQDEQLHVGRRLRELRQAAGLTQEAVAQRAGFSGKYVSEIERGQRDPPLSTLNALASAVGGTLEQLLRKDEEKKRPGIKREGPRILFSRTLLTVADLERELGRLPVRTRQRVLKVLLEVVALAIEDAKENSPDWLG